MRTAASILRALLSFRPSGYQVPRNGNASIETYIFCHFAALREPRAVGMYLNATVAAISPDELLPSPVFMALAALLTLWLSFLARSSRRRLAPPRQFAVKLKTH
jgi:hypothetical protein